MSKIDDAKKILKQLGLPEKQQNSRSAGTLLALLAIKKRTSWANADNQIIGIHNIIEFLNINYKFNYAENTRESIRRQTIHQFEQAGLIERNRDNPSRPINSGKTVYSITPELLTVIKFYRTKEWKMKLDDFLSKREKLVDRYMKKRSQNRIPLKIDNVTLELSAGKHNEVQIAIVKEFAERFAKNSELLYIGDTEKKDLYYNNDILTKIGIPFDKHSKLPDVVIYDSNKNWLYLIEAVTSHGPISPKRIIDLEELLKNCDVGKVYVTAFANFSDFIKYSKEIAWDTEVWIVEFPEHMIHFNGDRFLGPR
jgi:predicted PolB exonuclease-like 3'-5' exonuclease